MLWTECSWKWKVKVTQLCPSLYNPKDYTVHGILQARILERVAFPFSRGSSQPRDWTQVSCLAGGFFTSWATKYSFPIHIMKSWRLMWLYLGMGPLMSWLRLNKLTREGPSSNGISILMREETPESSHPWKGHVRTHQEDSHIHQNSYAEVLTPRTSYVNLFGNTVIQT